MDVGIILGGMILKHVTDKEKQEKLLERINMKQIKTDLENLVYDEFGEELDAKDKEIETKDKEIETKDKEIETKDKEIEKLNHSNKEFKNKAKELNELKDFNSPKAKQIIQSMMLL